MRAKLTVTQRAMEYMRHDLYRPHLFARERVGFLACRFGTTPRGYLLVLACDYRPVADEDYVNDRRYGAVIGSAAFRKAMQLAYSANVGVFHIHLHAHTGRPTPSPTDIRETQRFVPDFFHVRPKLPHGAIILSHDSISGRIWYPGRRRPQPIKRFTIVGAPLLRIEA
jgi:hypothetical protein